MQQTRESRFVSKRLDSELLPFVHRGDYHRRDGGQSLVRTTCVKRVLLLLVGAALLAPASQARGGGGTAVALVTAETMNELLAVSLPSGHVPAELFRTFADTRSRSLMIETTSNELATAIRVGNSGVARGYLKFAASCGDQVRTRSTELRPGG